MLTEDGERLLEAYSSFERELKEAGQRLFEKHLAAFAGAGPRKKEAEL